MGQKIPKDVNEVFEAFPKPAQRHLLNIRKLIFKCAAQDEAIGELTETLKWGEPAYLTDQSRSGSTIRLGMDDSNPDAAAIYFNCQTTLAKDIQHKYPGLFQCENNRVLYLPLAKPLPTEELSDCLTMALKYHVNKKLRKAGLL